MVIIFHKSLKDHYLVWSTAQSFAAYSQQIFLVYGIDNNYNTNIYTLV